VTVVPLYCALSRFACWEVRDIRPETSWGARFHVGFQRQKFERMLNFYDRWVAQSSGPSALVVLGFLAIFCFELRADTPLVGVAFFPRADAGQFVINLKAPTGTRIELTERLCGRVEDIVRQVVSRRAI
jgi:HAE1 family hydrophobic/amphiphilic exporter-1